MPVTGYSHPNYGIMLLSDLKWTPPFQGETLTAFCEDCEVLICKECARSSDSRHGSHSRLSTHEAAPKLKSAWNQGLSDLRLKRNLLDENRDMLGTKLSEINIKVSGLALLTVSK